MARWFLQQFKLESYRRTWQQYYIHKNLHVTPKKVGIINDNNIKNIVSFSERTCGKT